MKTAFKRVKRTSAKPCKGCKRVQNGLQNKFFTGA